MAPQALERATAGYRRGYNDAANGRDRATTYMDGVWAKDYEDGYQAGLNDLKWARK